MRVFAILAHPKKDSLSGNLFYSTVQHLKNQGIHVDVLDLYERMNQIPFYVPSQGQGWSGQELEQYQFYQENKERFMAADRLFIVYPIYWYAVPGIMKCWLDLITNYAWKFDKGPYGVPLHVIKKALVVNSASMSNWFRWLRTRNSGTEMLKESFKFMGIKSYYFYEIGNTQKMTPDQMNRYQRKLLKLSDWLVG